jgi:hypothetical protein
LKNKVVKMQLGDFFTASQLTRTVRVSGMNSKKLDNARRYLADFEADMSSSRAARNLADGLDILDEIITERDKLSAIAKNVGDTYAQKILEHVSQRLTAENATEPQLEWLFGLLTELEVYEYGDKKELNIPYAAISCDSLKV